MKVLALDTSTQVLSLALKTEEGTYTLSVSGELKHSERLVPLMQTLLAEAGISVRDLGLIVCAKGPGSFTGLRIGLATAKGISYASGCPLVSIPTLDMLAAHLSFYSGLVLPVLDARKNSFYTALFKDGERKSEYLDAGAEEISFLLKSCRPVILTGPGAGMLMERLNVPDIAVDPDSALGRAASLIPSGLERLSRNGPDPPDEGPLYIRKSDAELIRDLRKSL
ncbi:MAG: tRNA (adenosine(37)-N6)-threonylcarbamoyltransferase complex dimerization subunit type 1 TsaB [Spirochaetales bacterium]|nr:MAG: tRNA (adenosine(37)-N6)-threonylcarbamoyltransferase complex dimerization subunit type 1 TsaB [Spirochaetales bacterium]